MQHVVKFISVILSQEVTALPIRGVNQETMAKALMKEITGLRPGHVAWRLKSSP